jgi:AcrR family transcriptional regulator
MVAATTTSGTTREPTHRERVLATRRRMLTAAYRLFCENGYLATTMRAIAAEAGVAVQTLYFTFHTKGAILGETLGAAIVGFDRWTKPPREPLDAAQGLKQFHDWWHDFEAAQDARDALAIFVDNCTEVLRRVSPINAAMQAAASDPDVAAVKDLAERRRVDSYRETVRTLRRKNHGLRHGLSEARATDIVLVLLSAEVYQLLASGRGWSPAECTRFLTDLLEQQLLEH